MADDDALQAAIDEAVALVAHDPAWAHAFEAERRRLQALLPGAFVAIEHIGSTAIPGLPAKPVIDLLASVASMADADALLAPLCADGYATSAEFNATLADRRWLMRWRDGRRTHHLHLVVHGGTPWRARLAFRDALRADAVLATRYAALKQRLADAHGRDREAYTEGKSDFVAGVLAAAAGRAPLSRGG